MEYTFIQKLLGFIFILVILGCWYWLCDKAIRFVAKRIKNWWESRKAKYYHEKNLQNQISVNNESEE